MVLLAGLLRYIAVNDISQLNLTMDILKIRWIGNNSVIYEYGQTIRVTLYATTPLYQGPILGMHTIVTVKRQTNY